MAKLCILATGAGQDACSAYIFSIRACTCLCDGARGVVAHTCCGGTTREAFLLRVGKNRGSFGERGMGRIYIGFGDNDRSELGNERIDLRFDKGEGK